YEMVLFDGGNTHGDRWKHVFFPAQRLHYFIYEDF
ncbi:uridylate kinase, partial [Labrys sp. ZIDIC5]|nr:uridylate kinase [Labrys sp. ZIDIC5]